MTDLFGELEVKVPKEEKLYSGYFKYYGLYWNRDAIFYLERQLLGKPHKRKGGGNKPKKAKDNWCAVNFWSQKGIYILYGSDMAPVYAGQAGRGEAGTIGDRILIHRTQKYKNLWTHLSWFGFLECELKEKTTRKLLEGQRANPTWEIPEFGAGQSVTTDRSLELKELLASFEAVLIEGFIPRLNSRGGDLMGAVRCDQYEGAHPLANQ